MIVALGFGNTQGDTPSVYVVDTALCTPEWRAAIINALTVGRKREVPLPTEWRSLKKARVEMPHRVDFATFLYYEG